MKQTTAQQFSPDQVRESYSTTQNFHILKIGFIGASEHRPSRVKITSERFKQSVLFSYDHEYNNTLQCATEWLLNNGFNIVGHGESTDGYYVISSTFEALK